VWGFCLKLADEWINVGLPGADAAEVDDLSIVLTTLVEAYEEQHYSIPAPDPIDAIMYHMESRGLARHDLEPYLGSRARVAEVLNRKRPLSLDREGSGTEGCPPAGTAASYSGGRCTLGTQRSGPSSRHGTRGCGGAFAAIGGSHGGSAGTRRAGNRCAYCQLAAQLQIGGFEVDHILPRSRGGQTDLANLAFACPHCNARKCAYIDGEHPVSGQAIALFNPRTQEWAEHFQWSEQHPFEIEGITAHGRATVVRLQMNHPHLISIRRLLAELGLSWKEEVPRER
jgi:antitoxin component HigA of HigAB toxin-antitoxin module